jgi:hypothetical protein
MAVVVDIIKRSLKDPVLQAIRSKSLKMSDYLNTPVAGSSPVRSIYSSACYVCMLHCYIQSALSMVISLC